MKAALSTVPSKLALAAACGALAGAGFGESEGWLAVQVGLVSVLSLLVNETRARTAAGLLFTFVLVMYGLGESGLCFSVSGSLKPWTLLVLVGIASAHAACTWLTTCVLFRLPMSAVSRLLFAIPALWVGREMMASRVDISVPWLAVGYVHAPDGPLVGLFPIGGVFLVSGAAVFAAAGMALACRRALPRPRLSTGLGLIALLLVIAGTSRVEWTRPAAEAKIELLQSGEAENEASTEESLRRSLNHLARAIASSNAALVVTPQLAIPKTPDSLPRGYLATLDERLAARNADALIGLYFPSAQPNEYYNAVQSIGASGNQHYLKQKLLPFGEYLPFSDRVNHWVNSMLEHPRANAARGPSATEPLLSGGLRLAIAVCYEVAFGESLRLRAASAEAIVDIASDGAHDSLQLARQTKQIAQARALEFQKPLVRTSDVRGTYFIDAEGKVSGELPARVAASAVHTVRGRTGLTPYSRWGDLLATGIASVSLMWCTWLRRAALDGLVGRPGRRVGRAGRPCAFGLAFRERGQVLPAALALLVIVAGFFYLMVNAGQAVTEKIRVTNAADAAAYSAAVVEARALNYDAYLNRAMLANEMAIAQMVSFASWIDYFATAADGFYNYVSDINYFMFPDAKAEALEVAFGGSAVVAAYFGGGTVKEYADYVIDYGAGIAITANDAVKLPLEISQGLVQANLIAGFRQGQIADQVAKAMDPRLKAQVVPVSHGFDRFTRNYSGNDRKRFADVATRSRGLFTRERNFTLDSTNVPLVRNGGALKKRGGTDLIGLDEWRGVDTLELHGQKFFCGKLSLSWCGDVEKPIGWGAIEVSAKGRDAGHGYHGNAYNENSTTARKADGSMRSPDYGYYSGIPNSQEIANVDPASDASTAITILVSKSQSDTLTSGNAATVGPSGRLAVFNDHPAGGKMMALSRAQVYFDRIAARADGKSELGSLYNPYWRVRLVAPTAADLAYAASQQSGLAIP